MPNPIELKINEWELLFGIGVRDLNDKVNYLSRKFFKDYEPLLGSHPRFQMRVELWLNNIHSIKDQYSLFKLIPELFYVGIEEFNTLYIEAFESIFKRWLIDILNLQVEEPELNDKISNAITETWFCPITDSLRINQFYHVNNINSSADYRPDWRSLSLFGEVDKIRKYIIKNNIKRIVLLEDFIGNGGQVSKTLKFVVDHFNDIPFLVIPLLICPDGVLNSKDFVRKNKNISIEPLVEINGSEFVKKDSSNNYHDIYYLAKKYHVTLLGSEPDDETIPPYSFLGYKKTGALVVMFSNTPNNSLPIIHFQSSTWKPLFLRHKRI